MLARVKFSLTVVALVLLGGSRDASGLECFSGGDFMVRTMGSTNIEIALAWEPVDDAQGYIIERATSCSAAPEPHGTYQVSAATNFFADTGKALNSRTRFFVDNPPTCSGGSNNGLACANNNDCSGGGLCRGQCQDGPNAGDTCTCAGGLPCTTGCGSGFTCGFAMLPNRSYCYQVRALLPGAQQVVSECLPNQQVLSGGAPRPRGVPGDLWADAVLGKSDFRENGFGKVTAYTSFNAGGIVIDKNSATDRLYLVDSGRNRVLGFDGVGKCGGGGVACLNDLDCPAGVTCALSFPTASIPQGRCSASPNPLCTVDDDCPGSQVCQYDSNVVKPTVVIGHDSMLDKSACNNDATFTTYPYRAPAGATSLCLIDPREISPAEAAIGTMMDVDVSGNLYVADRFNHRVLRFPSPFNSQANPNGPAANRVWGQPNFQANLENRGTLTSAAGLNLVGGPATRNPGVALDWDGNLWVADSGNHRVLRYPKCNGTQVGPCVGVPNGEIATAFADLVLGQDPNHPLPCTLSEVRPADWDAQPDDSFNRLAFPVDIAFEKPYCAGGPNNGNRCASNADCPGTNSVCQEPTWFVIADSWEDDGAPPTFSRVLAVALPDIPVQSQCTALSLPSLTRSIRIQPIDPLEPFEPGDPFRLGYCRPPAPDAPEIRGNRALALEFDNRSRGLWVNMFCPESNNNITLLNMSLFPLTADPPAVLRVTGQTRDLTARNREAHGFDLDSQGNLFISVKGQGVFRYPRAALQAQGISSDDNADSNGTAGSFLYYDSEALASSTSLLDARGAAVFGNQIVLADRDRLMIWNSFDGANFEIGGSSLVSGFAADSVFGQTTLATSVKDSESHLRPYFSAPKLVKKTSGDELWVYRRRFDDLLKFAGPISPTSQPGIELLPVSRTGRQPYCLCGGGPCNMSMQAMTSPLFNADEFDFAVDANGGATHVWFADRFNNRVFRVRDFETSSKCVDVVLGQPNATAMSCNRGQASPSNASLCVPYNVSLDDDGSLYVADNGDEGGTNHRILQWDAHHFDVPSTKCPTTPCYAPTADRVIGTGGSFSIAGDATTAGDPFLSPYGSAFSGIGHMATINNPFPELSSRFATVFANPIAVQVPQLVLGDYLSNPRFTPHFDTKGNLLVPDANNGRTLVYDKPLAVAECLERKCVGDCNVDCSVTADEIITTISASLGEVSLDSCRYGDSTRDGAITVEEIIQSVGSSLEGCGLALPPASSTTANLEVWPASGTRGSFVTIIVVLEDGQTEVSGANFDFNFPTNVMTAPVCSIAGTMMPTGHELNTSDPEPGCHRAVIMDSDDYPIATVADGPIIACQTQILASAPYGTHQISLSRANLSDAYGNEVLCGTAAGTLTVNTGSGGGCQTTESGGFGVPYELSILALYWLVAQWRKSKRQISHSGWFRVFAVCLVACSLASGSEAQEAAFATSGTWYAEGKPDQISRSWHIKDLEWTGKNTVSGRIALIGSSILGVGTFEATIMNRSHVVATIRDATGVIRGTLDAELRLDGMIGTLRGDTGEIGAWEWQTPDAARLSEIFEYATTEIPMGGSETRE